MRCSILLLLGFIPAALGAMLLQSPVFRNYEDIPADYACDAYFPNNLLGPSPPLEWFRAPEKVQSFVLVVDDVTSEEGSVHWLVTNIPKDVRSLEKDASRYSMPPGSLEFRNSLDLDMGFSLMCPIGATHTYRFRLYALRIGAFNFTDIPLHYSVSYVENQLLALGDDVLYVSTLVGKLFVQPPPPVPVYPSPSSSPQPHYVEPLPMLQTRYVKPSEILKNKRKHYSPRPLASNNLTNVEDICSEFRRRNSSILSAQMCGDSVIPSGGLDRMKAFAESLTPRAVKPDLIEAGGAEIDENKAQKPVAAARQQAAKADKLMHHVMAAQIASSSDSSEHHIPQVTIPSGPIPAVAHPATKFDETGEADGLLEWECDSQQPQPLTLRSPMIDACEKRGLPVLSSEFICDPHTPSAPRASPPLVWRLLAGSNTTECSVHSYVLLLENLESQAIHWMINNIPASTSSLSMDAGLGEVKSVDQGNVLVNSFNEDSYRPPCAEGRTSMQTYRFHLLAVPSHLTHLTNTNTLTASMLKEKMPDLCFETHLDFAVLPSSS